MRVSRKCSLLISRAVMQTSMQTRALVGQPLTIRLRPRAAKVRSRDAEHDGETESTLHRHRDWSARNMRAAPRWITRRLLSWRRPDPW